MKNMVQSRAPVFLHSLRPLWCVLLLLLHISASGQQAYVLIPEDPRPGEPVTVAFEAGTRPQSGFKALLLSSGGKRLSQAAFFAFPLEENDKKILAALLAVPSTAESGAAVIHIEGGGIVHDIPLVIKARNFASEEIELNAHLTGIRTAPDPQKTSESQKLWTILNTTGTEIFWPGAFTAPVTSTRRTSFFGDRRIFKYSDGKKDQSIHAGVDYGVPTGTVVSACGAGRVVLACPRIVTGNSVVIEHAPGVYSLYYHLDKIEVAEGDIVQEGVKLGLSGATGLATGPHLHWEVRVSGENTDPDALISRPILDKDAILAKMNK
jgi:murein DD-endopeptidase MepM/ murein hydrolase activator NlpD